MTESIAIAKKINPENTDVVLVSAKGIFEEVRNKLAKECPDIEIVDLIALLEQ